MALLAVALCSWASRGLRENPGWTGARAWAEERPDGSADGQVGSAAPICSTESSEAGHTQRGRGGTQREADERVAALLC